MKRILCGIAALLLLGAGCAGRQERALREDLYEEMVALRLGRHAAADGAAEATLPESPRLEDYLRFAALKSPALRAAYYRWAAAVEKAPQARALPNPTLSYTHYLREVETRVGPQRSRLGLMQKVPWPTKITSAADRAVREALSRQYLYDAEKLSLFYRVRRAYYEYYYLRRSARVVQDSLTLLQNVEDTIRVRYEAAAAPGPALTRLQVELGKLENRLAGLRALRPALAARLNEAIGRAPEAPLPWPEEPPGELPALAEEELLAALSTENPGLQAAREKVRAAASGVRLARAQYLPDVGLGVSVIETDRRTDADPDDNGKDPVMLTLDLSLPIWWGKVAAGVRQAEAERAAAESELARKSQRLTADLRMAFFHYGDAERKQNLFAKTLVPKAEQALEATRTSFAAGEAAFADLLDAERTLLEFRLMAERATVDRAVRLAELEMLSGRPLRRPAAAEAADADE
jgi:outer membrane protein TolC